MMTLDRETLEAALIGYEQAMKEIDTKIEQLRAHLRGHLAPAPISTPAGKGTRSAAVRKRMAAAQQKRWAAKRAAVPAVTPKSKAHGGKAAGKRAPLSAEARERIAAAQRNRWAASKKNSHNK
jgi:hypothetical protein